MTAEQGIEAELAKALDFLMLFRVEAAWRLTISTDPSYQDRLAAVFERLDNLSVKISETAVMLGTTPGSADELLNEAAQQLRKHRKIHGPSLAQLEKLSKRHFLREAHRYANAVSGALMYLDDGGSALRERSEFSVNERHLDQIIQMDDRPGRFSHFTTETEEGIEYPLWYATNRKPVDLADHGKGYSAERDDVVHRGTCRVLVPKGHRIGSLGSGFIRRLLTGVDDRLHLLAVEAAAEDSFWQSAAARLAALPLDDQTAIVFVHGYNVAFEEAALRAAQIGFDLAIKGVMAFFSWPSQGTLVGYPADTASVEASEAALAQFLVDVAERSGARSVHVFAHSMGNRAVLRASALIAERSHSNKLFDQFILAAADVDAEVFRQRCSVYGTIAKRATLYVSARDRAVKLARWLYDFPRAGFMPPVTVVPGVDTVNVTNIDLTQLGHSYIGSAHSVLFDLYQLLTIGAPPEKRFGLEEVTTDDGRKYWVLRS